MTKSSILWTFDLLVISWTMRCIESWSSRCSQVFVSPPFSILAIRAPLWTCRTSIQRKEYSNNPISSKKQVRVFWASCLLMRVEIWAIWPLQRWASSRRLRQAEIRTKRPSRPRHLRQMWSCGLEARILKLRKSLDLSRPISIYHHAPSTLTHMAKTDKMHRLGARRLEPCHGPLSRH